MSLFTNKLLTEFNKDEEPADTTRQKGSAEDFIGHGVLIV